MARHGSFPLAGGWANQPLRFLVELELLAEIREIYLHLKQSEGKTDKLTPYQRELFLEIEKEIKLCPE